MPTMPIEWTAPAMPGVPSDVVARRAHFADTAPTM
jgi:hypothetical protein